MKKLLYLILCGLVVAGVVYSAQTTVNTASDSFETAWDRQQAMNTELYGKWTALGTNHDTSGELDALYEGELTNSAGLAAALSDETGTGAAVFANSPTLVTPALGTIASGVGTALTALNGENIQNDTIDDDSIDWTDVTLADFTEQTAWRIFYSNGDGDVTELAHGSSGTYLQSQGASSAPTWSTPSGSGDVSKVGTPADNQLPMWDGDGTIEAVTSITYNGTTFDFTTNTVDLGDATVTLPASQITNEAMADDDHGDFTYSSNTATIDNDAVTTAKINTDAVTMDSVDADGNFTSLTGNWATTGLLSGGVVTNSKSANYTVGTDNAAESYGGIIYVTSAATITAPAVATGMSFHVITIGATAVSVDVNASDRMYLDGTALDDGDKATNTSTTGDMISFYYESAAGWYVISGSPDGDKWTDGGA